MRLHGLVHRHCHPDFADISEATLRNSITYGGRFNVAGVFGAIYVALDEETAFRELVWAARKFGFPPLPRTLLRIDVSLQRVADLTQLSVREQHDIHASVLVSDEPADLEECRLVGAKLRAEGFEAVRSHSARSDGDNLAVFVDRLDEESGSYMHIIETREITPDELRPYL